MDEPVRIPLTDELDLHTFAPRECHAVLEAYLEACVQAGIGQVRLIHGKGTGTLRETVHSFLRKSPLVTGFCQADEASGGWGATRAKLVSKPLSQGA